MNCLCCGKPLRTENTDSGWHKSCIKRFFGTAELPEIAIDEAAFETLAAESTNKGYTVPGVQKKLSLHLFSEGNTPRLTLVNYPTGYILKPQVPEFEALPQAEQLVMCMADTAGISTVPHALIMEKDSLAYITKRVDRIFTKNSMQMLAMEDFCQLDLRLTQDKYKGSYERCAKIIERYSSRKGLDITELYLRIVFSFLVGNSDMHLKNFSLIETEEGSGKYVLSLRIRPTSGQCYHAGGQGAVRPCHERQKDTYPQEGFSGICREMRHDTGLCRENDRNAGV